MPARPTQVELAAPAFHHSPSTAVKTDGPLVAELCDLVGFHPDPQQRLCLDDIFAVNVEGGVAAYEAAVIAARQNIKTSLFKMCVLGWVYVIEAPLIVWSSHELTYALEAQTELEALIDGSKRLRRRFVRASHANGRASLTFVNSRVMFKARTSGGGRSLTADRLILDEGYAVRGQHMGALQPTLSAVEDPQLVYGSSACHADSDVLRTIVKRGRSASQLDDPAVEPRLAYAEWANTRQGQCERGKQCSHLRGTPGCLADDPAEWAPANPTLGYRIRVATVVSERASMPAEEFVRERMGWHEGLDDESALPVEGWSDGNSDGKITAGRAIAIDISPRRDWVSVAVAGQDKSDGRRVELLGRWTDSASAVKRVKRYVARHGLDRVYMIAGSQAATTVPDFEDEGIDVTQLTTRQYGQGCAWVFEFVRDAKLGHPESVELNTAVDGVRLRDNGEGGWVWSRKQSTTDISPLVAVTAALWGHMTDGEVEYVF